MKPISVRIFRTALFAFVLSVIFTLLLALVAKLFCLDGNVLTICNFILKGVAVMISVLLTVRGDKLIVNAFIGTFVFCVMYLALYLILGGSLQIGSTLLDSLCMCVIALIVAIIKASKS